MSDNETKPARAKRKGCLGRAISWFFTIILIVVVGTVAIVFFVAPVNKIKLGAFDLSAVALGETTLGEILEGDDITVYGLLNVLSLAAKADDALITNAPAQADADSAKEEIEAVFGKSLTDAEVTELSAGVLAGETPSDETGVEKLITFTDKETAALLNLALAEYSAETGLYAEFEQIVLNGSALSCVMSADMTKYTQSIPDWLKNIVSLKELRIQSVYTLTFEGSKIKAQNTSLTFGSLNEEDAEILTKMLEPLLGGKDLSAVASELFTAFINNLGTLGAEVGSPGIGGLSGRSISVIVAND